MTLKIYLTKADFLNAQAMNKCLDAIQNFNPYASAPDKLFRQKFESLLMQLKRNLTRQEIITQLKGNGYIDDYKQSVGKLNEICRQIHTLNSEKANKMLPNNDFRDDVLRKARNRPRQTNQEDSINRNLQLSQVDRNFASLAHCYANGVAGMYIPSQQASNHAFFRNVQRNNTRNVTQQISVKRKQLLFLQSQKLVLEALKIDLSDLNSQFNDLSSRLLQKQFYIDYQKQQYKVKQFSEKQENRNVFQRSSMLDQKKSPKQINESLLNDVSVLRHEVFGLDDSIHVSKLGWDDID